IPPRRVTERAGFSNLLAWTLTGQGNGTQTFLDTQTTMFFDSGEACVFHPNATKTAVDTAVRKQPGYIATHNSNAYGEAANSLGITPSRGRDQPKYTVEEKFLGFYKPEVEDGWEDFIGPELCNQDPATFTGKKRTWMEGLEFIQKFGFFGLKGDGLTTLQLANNLVLLGICEPPEPEVMAAWIADKGDLGAFKGLRLLGFNVQHSDPLATRAAFLCVYNHLKENLSSEDKTTLGFSVIFLEHVLCKVQRWTSR
ncbi:hypothetical protein C8R46DRAFT_854523, partial [Mycena filopes]